MRIVPCEQYSPSWWDAKRGLATSSYADRICTAVKGEISKSSIKVVYELLSQFFDPLYGCHDEYVSVAMRTGSIREPESRRFYEMERNCDVQEVGLVMTDDGRFGASPDSLVGDDGLLELKNPTAKVQIEYLHGGCLPAEYKPQIHWQLIVTQRKWADFMAYHPGLPPLLVRVQPDEYTVKVAEAMEAFWRLYSDVKASIQLGGDPVAATRKSFVSHY